MYKHVPISNNGIWEATRKQWVEDALTFGDEGVFLALDVENRFDRLKSLTEGEENMHSYFLVKEGGSVASSILEVCHAFPRNEESWLKLLNITPRPSLLAVDGKSPEALKELFQVLANSISHAIELIFHEHPAKELKIYGRTQEMYYLFEAILSSGFLDPSLDAIGLSTRLESKWLVLEKKEA